MSKGEQRGNREKKKPKKDKAAKHAVVLRLRIRQAQQPSHITDFRPGKKQ